VRGRRLVVLAVVAVLVVLTVITVSAAPAMAQAHGGDLWAGLEGGVGLPQGDAKAAYREGWFGTVFLLAPILSGPSAGLSIRAEGHGLLSMAKEFEGVSGEARIYTYGGAIEVHFQAGAVRPFLVGGAGNYTFRLTTKYGAYEETEQQNCFGWSAGGGIAADVGRVTLFVEARYHRASFSRAPFVFVPVTIGIAF